MKDAKGHGSDARGAAAHQQGVESAFSVGESLSLYGHPFVPGSAMVPGPNAAIKSGPMDVLAANKTGITLKDRALSYTQKLPHKSAAKLFRDGRLWPHGSGESS